MELAADLDDSPVMTISRRKSVSSEETLLSDIDDKKVLNNYILEQAESVARQLRKVWERRYQTGLLNQKFP